MARAVAKERFIYDINDSTNNVSRAIIARCYIQVDKFNVQGAQGGQDEGKIIKSTVTSPPLIKFTVRVNKNEKEFGIQPRYVILRYVNLTDEGDDNKCLSNNSSKTLYLPIFTITQFDALQVFDFLPNTTQNLGVNAMRLNTSYDGSTGLTYVITKKVDQLFDGEG